MDIRSELRSELRELKSHIYVMNLVNESIEKDLDKINNALTSNYDSRYDWWPPERGFLLSYFKKLKLSENNKKLVGILENAKELYDNFANYLPKFSVDIPYYYDCGNKRSVDFILNNCSLIENFDELYKLKGKELNKLENLLSNQQYKESMTKVKNFLEKVNLIVKEDAELISSIYNEVGRQNINCISFLYKTSDWDIDCKGISPSLSFHARNASSILSSHKKEILRLGEDIETLTNDLKNNEESIKLVKEFIYELVIMASGKVSEEEAWRRYDEIQQLHERQFGSLGNVPERYRVPSPKELYK